VIIENPPRHRAYLTIDLDLLIQKLTADEARLLYADADTQPSRVPGLFCLTAVPVLDPEAHYEAVVTTSGSLDAIADVIRLRHRSLMAARSETQRRDVIQLQRPAVSTPADVANAVLGDHAAMVSALAPKARRVSTSGRVYQVTIPLTVWITFDVEAEEREDVYRNTQPKHVADALIVAAEEIRIGHQNRPDLTAVLDGAWDEAEITDLSQAQADDAAIDEERDRGDGCHDDSEVSS
jgi:hypothetical protein